MTLLVQVKQFISHLILTLMRLQEGFHQVLQSKHENVRQIISVIQMIIRYNHVTTIHKAKTKLVQLAFPQD